MKNLFFIFMAVFTFTISPLHAQETTPKLAVVQVKGMVCDFCAQSLKKVFGKKEAVKEIDVNLDTQTIRVFFREGQRLNDKEITEAITWGGYDLVKIEYRS